jgi:hypothetical protein
MFILERVRFPEPFGIIIENSFSINPKDVSTERPGADKEAPKK